MINSEFMSEQWRLQFEEQIDQIFCVVMFINNSKFKVSNYFLMAAQIQHILSFFK